MGTFHDGLGELHGITVVVHGRDGRTWVGRCHSADAQGVQLHDADLHEPATAAQPREQWLSNAVAWGIWPRLPHVLVPAAEVARIERLGALRG